jgi:uncharacterized protein YbcI
MTGRFDTYRRARQERANSQVACRLPLAGGPPARSDAACAISCEVMRLLREHTTTVPGDARTVFASDRAIVILRDCLSSEELYLARRGHAELVMRTRVALYEAIRDEASAAIEAITHHRVVGYVTEQEHEPDVTVMAFVLRSASRSMAA